MPGEKRAAEKAKELAEAKKSMEAVGAQRKEEIAAKEKKQADADLKKQADAALKKEKLNIAKQKTAEIKAITAEIKASQQEIINANAESAQRQVDARQARQEKAAAAAAAAATTIQKVFRGRQGKTVANLKQKEAAIKQAAAATTIQKVVRGVEGRNVARQEKVKQEIKKLMTDVFTSLQAEANAKDLSSLFQRNRPTYNTIDIPRIQEIIDGTPNHWDQDETISGAHFKQEVLLINELSKCDIKTGTDDELQASIDELQGILDKYTSDLIYEGITYSSTLATLEQTEKLVNTRINGIIGELEVLQSQKTKQNITAGGDQSTMGVHKVKELGVATAAQKISTAGSYQTVDAGVLGGGDQGTIVVSKGNESEVALAAGSATPNLEAVKEAIKILGLQTGFTEEDLNRSFRTLARGTHPDSTTGNIELFQSYQVAKELLSEYLAVGVATTQGVVLAIENVEQTPVHAHNPNETNSSRTLSGRGGQGNTVGVTQGPQVRVPPVLPPADTATSSQDAKSKISPETKNTIYDLIHSYKNERSLTHSPEKLQKLAQLSDLVATGKSDKDTVLARIEALRADLKQHRNPISQMAQAFFKTNTKTRSEQILDQIEKAVKETDTNGPTN